ncbi:hypothetical protein [Mycoplasmopsis synoviae]|uniref:Uncharacterized protein n=1 Tax=Mycoplasmopsis synoviae TaxID=2109 RepID=A0AAN1EDT8_MYCSY|nr:hypothetical protein [Mycoplasmopsis synoviae]AKJ20776.1 hypothetical protein MSHv_03020 [Mycoplasmopsis synoviae]AQU48099.1 hypothetical protein ADF19_03020 [Mycoplasmopsis synoviae]UZF64181.1 hypothetical protein N0B76_02850 [Mycoplasmopsis synoviae]UZF64852.1 hypothetical protein N0B75_02850 [Mycoplasmopsis synoviae]UZF65524.1 hypothetical protein N0B74_02855 [Mycoplasmopsis synoviae]
MDECQKYLKDLFVAKAKGANYYAVEALKEKAKDLNWKLGKSWEKWRQVESWIKSDEFTSSIDTSGKLKATDALAKAKKFLESGENGLTLENFETKLNSVSSTLDLSLLKLKPEPSQKTVSQKSCNQLVSEVSRLSYLSSLEKSTYLQKLKQSGTLQQMNLVGAETLEVNSLLQKGFAMRFQLWRSGKTREFWAVQNQLTKRVKDKETLKKVVEAGAKALG